MNPNTDEQVVTLLFIAAFLVMLFYRRRWRPSQTAFGTATWMSESVLRAAGMLRGRGLILGRTFSGTLIRLPQYCHVLVCGGTGSGKGVSIILPTLISFFRGSLFCFDPKGDLYENSAKRRAAKGERIIRIAPFNGGTDRLNPLDTIPSGSPMLVDSARAMAEAIVARRGTESSDPHWDDKAVQVICAVLVLVLLMLKDEERSLNSVQEITSDPDMLKAAAKKLRELGGIPARLGAQLKPLFDSDGAGLTKEGAGVLSTVSRHLSFLDSELVARSVATSTFDPAELRKPGITLYLQIPPEQLDAQRGLLRCWVSTVIRVIGAVGDEREGEVLVLLDEASALGSSLSAVEEALVRGRSAGVRLVLAYQSDSQIRAAFRDKPTLLYDNCSTQIYLGAASSYETAERLSKSIGDWTQVLENYAENESYSWQQGGASQSGGQMSRGSSQSYSVGGRALVRPEELLTLSNDYLIAMLRGMSPILAQRVKWYQDRDFNPAAPKRRKQRKRPPRWRLVVLVVVGLILLKLASALSH